MLIALLILGIMVVVLAVVGLLAAALDGDFDTSYQDDLPLMIYGVGLWALGGGGLYWIRRREVAHGPTTAATGCVLRTTAGLRPRRNSSARSFRAGLRKQPLFGLALLFNLLALLVRIYAASTEGPASDPAGVVIGVAGVVLGLLVVAGVFVALVHRGAVAARRIPAVRWISPVGIIYLGATTDTFAGPHALAERIGGTRFVAVRLVLTPAALILVPNRLNPRWVAQIPLTDIAAIDIPINGRRFVRGLTVALRDGRKATVGVRADDDFLHQMSKLGAKSGAPSAPAAFRG